MNNKIIVNRAYFQECTLGRLIIPNQNFYCATLELPWKNNEKSISCIPEGIYNYRVALSPSRKRDVIWIDRVPQRSAIQIHEGNFTRQIEGCLLVGDGIRDINSDGIPDVTNSLAMFNRILGLIQPIGTIEIRTASMMTI